MTLVRTCVSELVGTAFLVATVVGSGIMATELTDDVALQLLINSTATGAVLVALILALQPISAAFNPVVTLVQRTLGQVDSRSAAGAIGAQVVGGVVGAVLANVMFDRAAVSISSTERAGAGIWVAEVVATLGLVLVIFALVAAGRTESDRLRCRRLHRRGLLVHQLDQLRQPGRDHRPDVLRLVRRDRAGERSALRPHAAHRRRAGRWAAPRAASDPPGVLVKPTVLFVCVHNAGRSQMAAGWLQHLAGDRVDVLSAGSAPADSINPTAVAAMAEVGIDITAARPKVLTDGAVQASDVVITMGCGDACPFYPGKRYEDWQLDDPAGQGIDAVRPIRDEIRARVEALIAEIAP